MINTWGATWLNITGKVVLIKAVLSSIPIYQCSILLAPKGVLASIESLLKKFLWKGGKQNEKNLPLVSWDKVAKPLMQGGLQIRQLAVQNLALGAKILWNIISGKPTWCKSALWKKYFTGSRLRCLNNSSRVRKGSTILPIVLKALSFLLAKIMWIPEIGKHIKVWEDLIMGDPSLS